MIVDDRDGNAGDTVELRLHYRDFVRMDLGGKWLRVPDYHLWRMHGRFVKNQQGVWTNNGSSHALDHTGW